MSGQPEFRAHKWLSKDGLSLYSRVYDAAGSAAPQVLCLPGLTRNSKDFEDLALHLSPRYRVICPDLRGRGLSAPDPVWQNYHPRTYLADLAGLVAGLGVQRLTVVGTSLGGLLAMSLPAFLPGIIGGVVLNDIGPESDPVGIARIKGYVGQLPPVRSWEEAVAQLRVMFGAAWPDFRTTLGHGSHAAATAKTRPGRRCSSATPRSARRCVRPRQPRAACGRCGFSSAPCRCSRSAVRCPTS